jgi:OOP family OmpA-OmpF porin
MSYMNDGVKNRMPKQLAAAQASYECWMQEQEENFQAEDIAACRADFDDAIASLTKKPVAMRMDNTFTVYFGLDSSKLEGDAMMVIAEAADAFKATKAKRADVGGHADSSGDANYNDRISALRAQAVSGALVDAGVPEDAITISAFGENDQAVKTKDGQTEPRNRRVTITLSK